MPSQISFLFILMMMYSKCKLWYFVKQIESLDRLCDKEDGNWKVKTLLLFDIQGWIVDVFKHFRYL